MALDRSEISLQQCVEESLYPIQKKEKGKRKKERKKIRKEKICLIIRDMLFSLQHVRRSWN